MIILYKLLIILITFVNYSYANNIDIQKQLDIQNEIIDIQSKRIDQLEIIIKELKIIFHQQSIVIILKLLK